MTVSEYWREAIRDLAGADGILGFERYNLVTRSMQTVQGLFAEVVSEFYMTEVEVQEETTAKYSTSATWDVDTLQLTSTMSTSWASTDVGNKVYFRKTTAAYGGVITARISATVVQLAGLQLPTVDVTGIEEVLMLTTNASDGVINISQLNLLRYGSQSGIVIGSSLTKNVEPVTRDAFKQFYSAAPQNANKVVWCLVGNQINYSFGDSLSSAGTLTLWYPRTVTQVFSDNQNVDLLEGSMLQIGIKVLTGLVAKRLGLTPTIDKEELQGMVVSLLRSQKQEASKEEIKQKVEALL